MGAKQLKHRYKQLPFNIKSKILIADVQPELLYKNALIEHINYSKYSIAKHYAITFDS